MHVPLPGEPAYGGQGGSGWTTPVLRPQDGGRSSEASSIISSTSSSSKRPAAGRLPSSPLTTAQRGRAVSGAKAGGLGGEKQLIPGPGDEVDAPEDAGVRDGEKVTVVFLVSAVLADGEVADTRQCEQVSHHPPVSAAYYGCPEKGIEAIGIDQIAAKVSFPCEPLLLNDVGKAASLMMR